MSTMAFRRNLPPPISGQVPNQSGAMLPASLQQNGNPVPTQMQNASVHQNVQNTDQGIASVRGSMRIMLLNVFMERLQQLRGERNKIEYLMRLEEILFRSATTMEEYSDRNTLPSRVQVAMNNMHVENLNQQLSHSYSTVSFGAMIPDPEFLLTGYSSLNLSTVCPPVINSSLNRITWSTPLQYVSGEVSRSIGEHGGQFSESFNEYSNGPFTGGLGIMRNMPMINAAQMGNNSSGPGNLYAPVISTESVVNADCSFINKDQPHAYAALQTINTGKYCVQPHQKLQPSQYSDQVQCQQLARHPLPQKKNLFQNQLLSNSAPSQCSHYSVALPDSGIGSQPHEVYVLSQFSNPLESSGIQSPCQQNSLDNHSGTTRTLLKLSHLHGISSPLPHTSEHMQQQFCANSQGDFGCLTGDTESVQEHLTYEKSPHTSGTFPPALNIQEVSHNRLNRQEVQEQNNMYLKEQARDSCRSSEVPKVSALQGQSNNENHERKDKNKQNCLLLLLHARRCPAPQGKCKYPKCLTFKTLLKHIEQCNMSQCHYTNCRATKLLTRHYNHCQDSNCRVCVPVNSLLQAQMKKALSRRDSNPRLSTSVVGSCKSHETAEIDQIASTSNQTPEYAEELQPSPKRMKIERGSDSLISEKEHFAELVSAANERRVRDPQHTEQMNDYDKPLEMEISQSTNRLNPDTIAMEKDNLAEGDLTATNNPSGPEVTESVKEMKLPLVSTENTSKSGKSNIKALSMTELFTPEQVRQHLRSLRQWTDQGKEKAGKNKLVENFMSEKLCQLCCAEDLPFEPLPIYCTPCGARIMRNVGYYNIGSGETRHCFCVRCYKRARGDSIVVDGKVFPKAKLEKKQNVELLCEAWVQCKKCEVWQHQICALFNGRRNEGNQGEYTCPHCYIEEVERGERVPLPQSAIPGAKDLPRTKLSDHLEQRLSTKLHQEREERARVQGKGYDEVPGAAELVIRVVSSVDKTVEVQPRFLEIFREENYPNEFPYKSKVVLLFQKMEAVEVCLFGIFLQEYGSNCQQPNGRRANLSYLDSVKYFRPDVKAVTGEALRTYVYHEILIGCLEHCQMRGFTSFYIWACPPMKGEDYILYCHPEIQKKPKSDKLRRWYMSMLKKAQRENIAVEVTNMYDHFFAHSGECKAKVTAARLPYFDGDYWPGAAEDIIDKLQQVEGEKEPVEKGTSRKTTARRTSRVRSGQNDLSNESKDRQLMQKIGERIYPMKKDFIVVHLQHACAHCHILMVSGNRWVCKQCKNFQLCDKCYDADRKCGDREGHPINKMDKHEFHPVEIAAVLDDTKDEEIVESEFFTTRHAFLNLCQTNHYQYDTLRRAKHSSMMVLYHLHNPTAPAFVCSLCEIDIDPGQGWRCETCKGYEVCGLCYEKDGGVDHPHKLIEPSHDRDGPNQEARQQLGATMQLKKLLELLVHSSKCKFPHCRYPNCHKLKDLFRHGSDCKKRASGGCIPCKRMWRMLEVHAQACKESDCKVPRCRDLKAYMTRQQMQSDSRRRVAIERRMRQHTEEVASPES